MNIEALGRFSAALLVSSLGLGGLASCSDQTETSSNQTLGKTAVGESNHAVLTLQDALIQVAVNDQMQTSVHLVDGGESVELSAMQSSFAVRLVGGEIINAFTVSSTYQSPIADELGAGVAYTVKADAAAGLSATLTMRLYNDFPGIVISSISYTNISDAPLAIESWANNELAIASDGAQEQPFWAFQGSSHQDRRDWVRPLSRGFEQRNFMGMNASDYGGGTPVLDVWRRDAGLAVGHIEPVQKLVSLPVRVSESAAHVAVEYEALEELAPGQSLQTFETFVSVHRGDYYATLKQYSAVMAKRGLKQPAFPDTSYEAIWCAWGYERGFNVDQIIGTLPKAKELGLKWAVLDDGWQTAEGDWYLNREKFPRGDADMIDFVAQINDAGLQAKLWVAPLAVDPGTDLLHDHSDMLLLDEWGAVHDVTWWNSFYLCPAYEPVIEHSKELVRTIMEKWGYAGLKIDGQHLNSVPPCHNPAHNHERPEESTEALQDYWKAIFETALAINPDAVIEICPCGTSYAFHNTPYMNQTVASDPLSSWQIRHKGKTLKALTGDSAPYYADHVELSDDASDFATAIGIGAVVGTKFTWPTDPHPENGFILTAEKEKEWSKWISLYNDKMLPKGVYKGELYDIGFDKPETHAIEKDGKMYFAFYADDVESWSGKVELRGLTDGAYTIVNYIDGSDVVTTTPEDAWLDITFSDYLLLEAQPVHD